MLDIVKYISTVENLSEIEDVQFVTLLANSQLKVHSVRLLAVLKQGDAEAGKKAGSKIKQESIFDLALADFFEAQVLYEYAEWSCFRVVKLVESPRSATRDNNGMQLSIDNRYINYVPLMTPLLCYAGNLDRGTKRVFQEVANLFYSINGLIINLHRNWIYSDMKSLHHYPQLLSGSAGERERLLTTTSAVLVRQDTCFAAIEEPFLVDVTFNEGVYSTSTPGRVLDTEHGEEKPIVMGDLNNKDCFALFKTAT